jgi:hypothetical protein
MSRNTIAYDPVVGEAIEKYGEVITRPRGVISHVKQLLFRFDQIEAMLGALRPQLFL